MVLLLVEVKLAIFPGILQITLLKWALPLLIHKGSSWKSEVGGPFPVGGAS